MEQVKAEKDQAIINLWIALSNLSKYKNGLTDQDIDLWAEVTNHQAVQKCLDEEDI
jgi:hypothetical protein